MSNDIRWKLWRKSKDGDPPQGAIFSGYAGVYIILQKSIVLLDEDANCVGITWENIEVFDDE